jgi:hypothetical protein
MFRHKGKNRTFRHNLLLAALLSSNAGLVNITGVLTIGTPKTPILIILVVLVFVIFILVKRLGDLNLMPM